MDHSEKPANPLGPAEALLVQAAEAAVTWHDSVEPAASLLAKAREKVPAPEIGTGGEMIRDAGASAYLRNTMLFPDFISKDASAQRVALAQDACALAIGVDLADSIEAANSFERLLSHEIGAAHVGAMKLLAQLNSYFHQDSIAKNDSANLRATRIAGAAARLLGACQTGMLTLDKIRTGGKQTILVQRVTVNEGGQAVVAGKMKAPSGKGKGPRDVQTSVLPPKTKQRKPRRGPEGGK